MGTFSWGIESWDENELNSVPIPVSLNWRNIVNEDGYAFIISALTARSGFEAQTLAESLSRPVEEVVGLKRDLVRRGLLSVDIITGPSSITEVWNFSGFSLACLENCEPPFNPPIDNSVLSTSTLKETESINRIEQKQSSPKGDDCRARSNMGKERASKTSLVGSILGADPTMKVEGIRCPWLKEETPVEEWNSNDFINFFSTVYATRWDAVSCPDSNTATGKQRAWMKRLKNTYFEPAFLAKMIVTLIRTWEAAKESLHLREEKPGIWHLFTFRSEIAAVVSEGRGFTTRTHRSDRMQDGKETLVDL